MFILGVDIFLSVLEGSAVCHLKSVKPRKNKISTCMEDADYYMFLLPLIFDRVSTGIQLTRCGMFPTLKKCCMIRVS